MGWHRQGQQLTESLFSTPWSRFAGELGLEAGESAGQSLDVLGVPMLAAAGEPPTWDGIIPSRASPEDALEMGLWHLPLPTVSGCSDQGVLRNCDGPHAVTLSGSLVRKKEEERGNCPRERWLNWQTQRYSEINETGSCHPRGLESLTKRGVRREWGTVQEIFAGKGEERAEISLVVLLAEDEGLIRAIRKISQVPRRMLLRQHAHVPIARIKEMDATTLRAYSRAPGRSAAQKAGARQELLAVVRRETADLLENRLLIWTAERIERMARDYEENNKRFEQSNRFQNVKSLRRVVRQALLSPELAEVSMLAEHPDSPTYCLQHNARYRVLWRTYMRIRKQEKVEDDAWRWQGRLWGTTVQILLGAALVDIDEYREVAVSTPSFLREAARGDWLAAHSTPGTFHTPFGDLHMVDLRSHDGAGYLEFLGIGQDALISGADVVLVWPELRRATFVWSLIAEPDEHKHSVQVLRDRLQQGSDDGKWKWSGWLIPAHPEVAVSAVERDSDGPLTTLRFPTPLGDNWGQLKSIIAELLSHEYAN